jgi:hypothetical protein
MLTSVLAFSFGGIGCGVGEANHGAHDGSVDRSDAGTRTSADGGSVVDASAPDRASDAAHLDTSAGGSSVFDASAPDRTADVAANDGTDSGNADPCLSAADAGVSPGVGVALVADSQSGFSPTQHHCSWTYGYIAPGVDGGAPPDAVADGGPDGNSGGDAGASAGFTLMSDYDPNGGLWRVERNVYWTAVGPTVQHGNGIITSGGYTPVEQWSVRRWTSTVDGPITITGSLYKTLVGDAGNGIDARIVVDGTIVYAQFIGPNDSIGVHFFVPANVMVGSAVDFVLDPHLKNDVEDWTAFIAQIWQ